MSKKPNPFLRQIEEKHRRESQVKFAMLQQMGLDAACIAAAEVLHMGPTKAKPFCMKFMEAMQEMAKITVEDAKDIEYAKHVIDQRIKTIVGEENFQPWEVRYG